MISSCPKISVIVPVYNTVDYLPECFDSILIQSIQDIEVIVVDDGSSDGCWEIIKKYAAKYPQFKIFKQNRKRQGTARNLGLKHAIGDYIAFLDSDDTLPDQAYEWLYDSAERSGSDMATGPYQSFFHGRKWIEVPVHERLLRNEITHTDIYSTPELLEDISVCNRLIKRSVIEKYQLEFPERYAGEDVVFMSQLYLKCKSISIVPHVIYNCRRKRQSASSFRITPSFFQNRKETAMELSEVFSANSAGNLYPYLLQSEVRKLVGSLLVRVVKELPENDQKRVFNVIKEMSTPLSKHVVYRGDYFNAVHKLCIRMLQEGEVDALISFEKSVTKITFLRVIGNNRVRIELAKLILPLYVLGAQRLLKKISARLIP